MVIFQVNGKTSFHSRHKNHMEKFTNGLVSIQVLIIHWPRVLLWSNFLTNAKISYWSTISRYLVNWQNGEYESMLEKKMQLFSLCGISIYFSYSFIYWMISLWFITKALLAKEREKSRDDFWTIFSFWNFCNFCKFRNRL